MKRRLIISICAAVFIFGIIGILNRTPTVTIGVVTLAEGADERELKGYEITTLRNGETTHTEQAVMKNNSNNAVRVNTNMSVAFAGKYVDDVTYAVYTVDGEEISAPAAQLNLPTKDIDSCVVKIDVKWGRVKNYKEYYYFFRVDFEKEV